MSWTRERKHIPERKLPTVAKQTITRIIDDLTGEDGDETVSFALDGNLYEIDLNSKNARDFRTFMDRFIQAGTRVGKVGQPAQLRTHRQTTLPQASIRANRVENGAIREWAANNGHHVSERGRIPQTVLDAYANRHRAAEAARALKQEQEAADAAQKSSSGAGAKKTTSRTAKKAAPAKFAAAS